MGMEFFARGDVPLKDGVTHGQILKTWYEIYGLDEDFHPMEIDDWKQWSDDNGVTFTFADGEFSYAIDGYFTIHIAGEFDDFVKRLETEFAAGAWISEEGEDRDEVIHGPDEKSKAVLRVEMLRSEIAAAQRQLAKAEKELSELSP